MPLIEDVGLVPGTSSLRIDPLESTTRIVWLPDSSIPTCQYRTLQREGVGQ